MKDDDGHETTTRHARVRAAEPSNNKNNNNNNNGNNNNIHNRPSYWDEDEVRRYVASNAHAVAVSVSDDAARTFLTGTFGFTDAPAPWASSSPSSSSSWATANEQRTSFLGSIASQVAENVRGWVACVFGSNSNSSSSNSSNIGTRKASLVARLLFMQEQMLLWSVAILVRGVTGAGLVSPAAGARAESAASAAVETIFSLWALALDVVERVIWLWVSFLVFWWVSLPLHVATFLYRAANATFVLFLRRLPGGRVALRAFGH